MKGFMRQRGSAWDLRVYLGKDPVSGKQRYVTNTVRGGKREAQRVLNAMVVDAERSLIARTHTTVGELLDAWLELATPDFSPKTVRETSGSSVVGADQVVSRRFSRRLLSFGDD